MNEGQVFPFFPFNFHQFVLPNTKYAVLLSSSRCIVSVFEYVFVSICVGFVMCGCFGNMYTVLWGFSYPDWGFSLFFPQL